MYFCMSNSDQVEEEDGARQWKRRNKDPEQGWARVRWKRGRAALLREFSRGSMENGMLE